jgi:DNA-binding CsgD family transcriptional regulator
MDGLTDQPQRAFEVALRGAEGVGVDRQRRAEHDGARIAERLGVSFSTVNTITSRIYRKLGVTRRASLVNAMRG